MLGAAARQLAGRARRRATIIGVLLAAVALLAAACGGSGGAASSSGKSGSTPTSTHASKSRPSSSDSAFIACLRRHGVNVSSFGHRPTGGVGSGPSFGTGGFNDSSFSGAFSACAKYRPSGASGFGGRNRTAYTAYRNCLERHGVTLPSGGFFAASGSPSANALNTSNPKVKAALSACAALRPSFAGFGGPSSSSNPSGGG